MNKLFAGLTLASLLTLGSFAKVEEFSPVKVLVDTDNNVVLREPSALDYDNAILDKQTKTEDRSLLDRIFRKPCGQSRIHL
jgi:hypothetical protein